MSYIEKYLWSIKPITTPVVRKNCPKCNEKTNYINSKKFRVNANKSNIDIWLIYQCEKCKTSWNMDIYERAKTGSISPNKYNEFMQNNKELAEQYGFDIDIHNKNKVDLRIKEVVYEVKKIKIQQEESVRGEILIEIKCKYPCGIRIDRLLSDNLNISRKNVKEMYEEGNIFIENSKNNLNVRVGDGMIIHII